MIDIKSLNTQDDDFAVKFDELNNAEASFGEEAIAVKVRQILKAIKKSSANKTSEPLLRYSKEFDGLDFSSLRDLEVDASEFDLALNSIDKEVLTVLKSAANRIINYHQKQLEFMGGSWSFTDASKITAGQKITALKKVGIYVPGGLANYPSSVLMNAIPAKIAGVEEIIMVTPADADGKINPVVLVAALIAKVDKVFKLGGVQAIGALTYGGFDEGVGVIPKVDKIVGPGNAYVTAAKKEIFGEVGIDMLAGPSEVLILADKSAEVDWIVWDMFAQAEHDENARVTVISDDANYLEAIKNRLNILIKTATRSDIIKKALETNGSLIKVRDAAEMIDLANKIAPEHLEVFVTKANEVAAQIYNAGAIFIGKNTAEAIGDYCGGTNHVLPTVKSARFSNPLGVYDFVKRTSVLEVPEQASDELYKIAHTLATAEGLQAHAESVAIRIKNES